MIIRQRKTLSVAGTQSPRGHKGCMPHAPYHVPHSQLCGCFSPSSHFGTLGQVCSLIHTSSSSSSSITFTTNEASSYNLNFNTARCHYLLSAVPHDIVRALQSTKHGYARVNKTHAFAHPSQCCQYVQVVLDCCRVGCDMSASVLVVVRSRCKDGSTCNDQIFKDSQSAYNKESYYGPWHHGRSIETKSRCSACL